VSQTQALLETLTLQGIDLWVDGEQLRYRGPKNALTPTHLDQLKAYKTSLLDSLVTTTYRATWEQQSAWDAYQGTSPKTTHHVAFAAQLHGPLDEGAFQRAWQTLVQRHTTLRTTYQVAPAAGQGNGNGQHNPTLLATIHGGQALIVTRLEAQHWRVEELDAQLALQQARPFDLTQGPLLRVTFFARAADKQVLLVTAPRITLDDASLARLLDEFGQLYVAAQNGAAPTWRASEGRRLKQAGPDELGQQVDSGHGDHDDDDGPNQRCCRHRLCRIHHGGRGCGSGRSIWRTPH